MNDMNNYRDYRDEDYRDYREDYREDYRDYREDYRNNRDYDRRGGKINNRNNRSYRNYREENYDEELNMCMEEMREQYRKLEDIAEMAQNPQEKSMLMRIAQKSKENYMNIKQIAEK